MRYCLHRIDSNFLEQVSYSITILIKWVHFLGPTMGISMLTFAAKSDVLKGFHSYLISCPHEEMSDNEKLMNLLELMRS